MAFIVFSFIFFISWYVIYRWRNRALFALAKQLHSSKIGVSLPLIGQSYVLRGDAEDRMNAFRKMGRKVTEMGGVSAFWHAHRLFILIADAEIADFVLKACLEKDDIMSYMSTVVGNGSIIAPVNIWRERRRVTSSVFTSANLKQFTPGFVKQSALLASRLACYVGAGPVPLWCFATAYTLDAVCETTFGLTVNAQSDDYHPFARSFYNVADNMVNFLMRPYLHIKPIFYMLAHLTGSFKDIDVLGQFVNKVVRKKQAELEQIKTKKRDDDAKSDHSPKQKKIRTFLELFMQCSEKGKQFTEVEVREEAMVLIIAAADTSAVAVGFTVMMLARHPEVQEKVYQEIIQVLGKAGSPTTEDLPKLVYMEAVLKESMRIYPPVPLIVRKAHKDITLPTGVTILKGCGLAVSIEAVHRNPKYWGADADHFKPERFLGTELSHPAAFMPFSYGPRGCIGPRYAMMSIKTALAVMLQKYRVLPADYSPKSSLNAPYDEAANPLRVHYQVMAKEVHGFTVQFEDRL